MRSLPVFIISAIVLLLFSFLGPTFTTTDFLLPHTSPTDKAYEVTKSPCSILEDLDVHTATLCTEYAEESLVFFSNQILDHVLGSFTLQKEQTSWSSCVSTHTGPEGFLRCFSSWTADRAQIPVGDQSLIMMIQRTLQNDILIGVLLIVFVILLPLLYAVVLLRFVIKPDSKGYYSLKFISSWSMLDVLALSLLITSIKGPSISIYISLGMSGYAFIISIAICKSIEYLSLKSFLKIEK
ncbi:MAG: hypothetical protein CL916_02595 [Deltaproteobacteria bacterium]|nr:hypothetical protein [Deltaproteobacteria bacterium]